MAAISLALTAASVGVALLYRLLPPWPAYAAMVLAALALVTAIRSAVIECNSEVDHPVIPVLSLMASVVLVGAYAMLVLQLLSLGRMH